MRALLSTMVLFITAVLTASQSSAQPALDGTWTGNIHLKDLTQTFPGTPERPQPVDGWWVTPIHANLLSDGKVLITGWSRKKEMYCEEHSAMGRQNGTTFVLDPADLENASAGTLTIQPLNEHPKVEGDVLYCAGHTSLPDGKVFFMGGARYENLDRHHQQEFGLNYARVFDPAAKSILSVSQPNLAGPQPTAGERSTSWYWYEQGMMWYPTTTRLPDGRVLITGGLARQTGPFDPTVPNNSLSVFDSKAWSEGRSPWTTLVEHEDAPRSLDINAFDYPHTFLLPRPVISGGRKREIAIYGGLTNTFAFVSLDPKAPVSERFIELGHGRRPSLDGYQASGVSSTAAMTSDGQLMMMGGGDRGKIEGQRLDLYSPATGRWRLYDTGITRIRGASQLLPDGTILILNGEEMWKPNDSIGDRRRPTLFDPTTGKITNLAPWPNDPDDRGYHNIALLLKDGRVLIGGGRTLIKNHDGIEQFRIGCERTDMRIFSPPYLFKGPRPVIKGLPEPAPIKIGGRPMELSYSGARPRKEGGVVLMALGASTHHFDQNQRRVPLKFSNLGKGRLKIEPPVDSFEAPVGPYILYLVSEKGVPSVGKAVLVTN